MSENVCAGSVPGQLSIEEMKAEQEPKDADVNYLIGYRDEYQRSLGTCGFFDNGEDADAEAADLVQRWPKRPVFIAKVVAVTTGDVKIVTTPKTGGDV